MTLMDLKSIEKGRDKTALWKHM